MEMNPFVFACIVAAAFLTGMAIGIEQKPKVEASVGP